MSVLVTGGAGFIGSVAVERLLAAGETVVVLDNLSKGYRPAVEDDAIFVEAAIQDTDVVRQVLAEHHVDTVMHFAASIAVGESCIDPASYFENNVVGVLSVLRAMVDCGTKHFILSSTAAVYGDPETVPITEEMPLRPKNPYGLSKRMNEQMLEWYGHAYGLRSVCLRYFNACGATDRHGEAHQPETHLIPLVIQAALGERPHVTVFGRDYDTPDGTCVRDYVHIADLADAHLLAMRYLREGGPSETVNLGNALGHSVLEIIQAVERVSGRRVPVAYGDRRPGDADRLIASSERARRILGWEPRCGDIDMIVQDAWNWRLMHPRGYTA